MTDFRQILEDVELKKLNKDLPNRPSHPKNKIETLAKRPSIRDMKNGNTMNDFFAPEVVPTIGRDIGDDTRRDEIPKDADIRDLLSLILKELRDERDVGKALYNNGTLSTTTLTVINTQISPGHSVKGYTIKNTGTTNIYFAHNIADQPELDVDVIDTVKTNPIFSTLVPGEVEFVNYNTQCIKSVHLLAVTGTPTYKIKLVW